MRRLDALLRAEAAGRPLALVRVAVGVAGVLLALNCRTHLLAIMEPQHVAAPALAGLPAPTADSINMLTAVWALAAVMLTIGLMGRWAAGAVAGCAVSAALWDLQTFSNHLSLLIVLCCLLALGRCAATWSMDARLRGGANLVVPYWPLFLIKVQIATMYGFTALSKFNSSFLAGETMTVRGVGHLRALGVDQLAVTALAATTIAVELFLAFGLWHRRSRPAAIGLGFALHTLIVLGVPGHTADLVPFALLSLAPYVLFASARPASRVVIWDRQCNFCRRWVAAFSLLDWFRTHRFVGSDVPGVLQAYGVMRAEADRAIQLVAPEGRWEGFDAVVRVLEACPMTLYVAPALRLPGVVHVGRRVYSRVAARRACALPTAS